MSTLPIPLTEFVGRERECREMAELLAEPGCRLLTLVGPGGMGKTRLAVEVARGLADRFADGVVFVPLQPVQSTEVVISAVADAIPFSLSGSDDPLPQLGRHLAPRQMLLVLDNFEHLLTAAPLLSQLLQMAPHVKCLATSRERLNLRGEWIYALSGLPVPASISAEAWQHANAVALFEQRARQARWDFSLAQEAAHVVEICQLVEGHPLALELAASWLQTIPCADIPAEIRRNLDFLATDMRDVAARHSSMRAVFATSWRTLSAEMQGVFARMSVFRGGALRSSAESVADATLPILTALVDKSLLRVEDGRYHVHELLRQFAAEKLDDSPDEAHATRTRHAHAFAHFLEARFDPMTSGQQEAMLQAVSAEMANIRAAWQWAIDTQDATALTSAAPALHTAYQYRGQFREGLDRFLRAVDALRQAPDSPEKARGLACLMTCTSWLELRVGRVDEAAELAQTAVDLYDELGQLPPAGAGTDPLAPLSLLMLMRGEWQQSKALGQAAWDRAEARQDWQNLAYAGHSLISGALQAGELDRALAIAQRTLTATAECGNRWFQAAVYHHLGRIYRQRGELATAKEYLWLAYNMREEFDDSNGMATSLGLLGRVALQEGDWPSAERFYQRTITIYRENGDRGGMVDTLRGLAQVSAEAGQRDQQFRTLWLALDEAHHTQIVALKLATLADVGRFLVAQDSPTLQQAGRATLDYVECYQRENATASSECVTLFGTDASPDDVVHWLQANVPVPVAEPAAISAEVAPPAISPDVEPLLEPLSERELEVLQLVAAGLKNREIAAELTVALSTVKTHINNIYGKLGVSSRVQAVARARELHLIPN